MSVAIVSTSVNPQPHAYELWATQGDLIIAGDVNSPPELEQYVKELGGRYLTPDDQEHWEFSDHIGWRSIQRRNAAVMEAYSLGYDYVATVDDDNIPTDDWVAQHIKHVNNDLPHDVYYVEGENNWVNIGEMVYPPTNQRGTPFGVANFQALSTPSKMPRVVVSTAQVLGDPDCDAITRITSLPNVTSVIDNVVVSAHQYAAFNSQATLWRGEWSPLIACLPHVGRYDDIFASFIAKRIMRAHWSSFYAGEPCVVQNRNKHDPTRDLKEELFGMWWTPSVVRALDTLSINPSYAMWSAYRGITMQLMNILPAATVDFMRAWANEWQKAGG